MGLNGKSWNFSLNVAQLQALTLDPASCGCHRKEDTRVDVLREAATHGDTYISTCKTILCQEGGLALFHSQRVLQ